MTVLIIGAPEEAHAAFIREKIQARGERAEYFDTRRFPGAMRIELALEPGGHASGPAGCIADEGLRLPLTEIRSVYWRYHMGMPLPPLEDPHLLQMASREIESFVGSLFRLLDRRWVNSPEAVAMHVYKGYQLKLLRDAGLRIPETLMTNNPDAVHAFYEKLDGRVICKPIRGGAHTQKLQPDDLKPERLQALVHAPVQFQELVEGVDIRVYLVGDEVFAGEIRSRTLDFRDDPGAAIVPVTLPDSVAEDCCTLTRVLGLLYSGIDVRRTPAGDYVFLEGNPCPMFMHFERQTHYPISDRLVDLLLHD